MKSRLTALLGLFMLGVLSVSGQQHVEIIDLEQRLHTFREKSAPILQQLHENRKLAHDMASEKGWVLRQVLPDGQVMSLEGVDENGMPIYIATDFNVFAAATTGADKLWPGGVSGLELSGSSEIMENKLAIWDGGIVLTTHQEMAGRVVIEDIGGDISNHATHVAGTMMASGVNPLARGMAFGAPNIRSWDFSNDAAEMSEVANELLVSNHSYGTIAGWRFNSSRAGTASNPNWEWYGDVTVSTTEDYKFGYYDGRARLWDMMAYYNPYYLVVKSSGNFRNNNGPNINEGYWRRNASGTWELHTRTPGMDSNDSYNTISTYGNAKNILSVGAVGAIPNGYRQPNDVTMSAFSSWGPTDDGRIKPDIVANGVSLYSSSSSGDDNYATMSGTSMSAPNTSGSIFLLQEYHHRLFERFMLSSTLRALVCHTADQAGGPGPDYRHGWGLLNVARAADVISDAGNNAVIKELTLNTGATITKEVTASGREPLVVTIAWTDPEATPLTVNQQVLNNRSRRLLNDLDLRVKDENSIHMPWVLDVQNPGNPAVRGDNTVDNIEQVVIEHPVPGKTYTIEISHKGSSLERVSQVFSLIATGVGGETICESGAESDEGLGIQSFVINDQSFTMSSQCQGYRNMTEEPVFVSAGGNYPFMVQIKHCDESDEGMLKLFAYWEGEEAVLVALSPVLESGDTFSSELEVPAHLATGSSVLLRLVLAETADAQEIIDCGQYTRGETQDYLLVIGQPEYDLAISNIPNLIEGICANDEQGIEIQIENLGSKAVSQLHIQANITAGGELLKQFDENLSFTLGANSTMRFYLNTTFETIPEEHYEVSVELINENDVNQENNRMLISFTTAVEAEPPLAEATLCDGDAEASLKAEAAGTTFWYDQAENGTILAAGNDTKLSVIPESGVLYAGVNHFSGRIGPETKTSEPWVDGTYARATAHPIIRAHAPLTIQSARLYVGYPGEVRFTIENYNTGEVVSMAELNVSATRNPPSPVNGAPMDPSDQGEVYQLNLAIPYPGLFRIRISYGAETTLYRATSNTSSPYPYVVPGALEITGTTATNGDNFYYWLYDIKLGSYGCSSPLVEVPINVRESPVLDLDADSYLDEGQLILNAANPGSVYIWNTGDTTQTIAPQYPGFYSVHVTNQYGCTAFQGIQITETPVEIPEGLNVSVYPNPATSALVIESSRDVRIEIINQSGQLVYHQENPATYKLVDVSSFRAGIYIVRVTDAMSGQVSTYRILIR